MTEARFLNFVFLKGIILSLLGFGMLVLPKISAITFGLILCISLFVYGVYKIVEAILSRSYIKHFILDLSIGILLVVAGIMLFMAPMFDILYILILIGAYFLLESISTTAAAIQSRKTLYLWWSRLVIAFLQFFVGLIVIVGLPTVQLWLIGLFTGIVFLVSGMLCVGLYLSTKYVYNF